ncbi:hypothetical protein K443DRAFT_104066, partial [Laccaria amethystina LaAM-08-1]
LGKWTHTHEIPTAEDILSDPSTISYTGDVNKALSPHTGVLHRLLTAPNSSNPEISSNLIPAKKWLEDKGKAFENTLIPYVGTLSITERAQIANWFETHISRDKRIQVAWFGFLPIAHAHTLFIAHRMTKNPTFKTYSEVEILHKAWDVQLTSVPMILNEIDVDRECLESLEEEMFESSDRTGVSGNFQWGLDAGHHQGGWDPSFGVQESWDGKKRVGSESEREVRLRSHSSSRH